MVVYGIITRQKNSKKLGQYMIEYESLREAKAELTNTLRKYPKREVIIVKLVANTFYV